MNKHENYYKFHTPTPFKRFSCQQMYFMVICSRRVAILRAKGMYFTRNIPKPYGLCKFYRARK